MSLLANTHTSKPLTKIVLFFQALTFETRLGPIRCIDRGTGQPYQTALACLQQTDKSGSPSIISGFLLCAYIGYMFRNSLSSNLQPWCVGAHLPLLIMRVKLFIALHKVRNNHSRTLRIIHN